MNVQIKKLSFGFEAIKRLPDNTTENILTLTYSDMIKEIKLKWDLELFAEPTAEKLLHVICLN